LVILTSLTEAPGKARINAHKHLFVDAQRQRRRSCRRRGDDAMINSSETQIHISY